MYSKNHKWNFKKALEFLRSSSQWNHSTALYCPSKPAFWKQEVQNPENFLWVILCTALCTGRATWPSFPRRQSSPSASFPSVPWLWKASWERKKLWTTLGFSSTLCLVTQHSPRQSTTISHCVFLYVCVYLYILVVRVCVKETQNLCVVMVRHDYFWVIVCEQGGGSMCVLLHTKRIRILWHRTLTVHPSSIVLPLLILVITSYQSKEQEKSLGTKSKLNKVLRGHTKGSHARAFISLVLWPYSCHYGI